MIEKLNKAFSKLPGVGSKTAQRFIYHLLERDRLGGLELAGALKNIYAIVSGITDAIGAGQNTKSVVLTRSLAEMNRFASELGANPMTFLGLSGIGDLYVTCTSPLSRNFRVGVAIGQGKNLEQAIEDWMKENPGEEIK